MPRRSWDDLADLSRPWPLRRKNDPVHQCPHCEQRPYTTHKKMRKHVERVHPQGDWYLAPPEAPPDDAPPEDPMHHDPMQEQARPKASLFDHGDESLTRIMDYKNMGLGHSVVAEVDAMLQWVATEAKPVLSQITTASAAEDDAVRAFEVGMAQHAERPAMMPSKRWPLFKTLWPQWRV